MIDRVLNFGPVQQDSYYFQLIPISLAIVKPGIELPAAGTTYRFSVSKGQQKFDENKIPIEASFQVVAGRPVLAISSCRLNFYLPNYNKARKQEFALAMVQREQNQDYELGDFKISADDLVAQFKEANRVRHEFKTNFADDYELEFEIYVERNRMALERTIRENKTERINKSPLRSRKEERVESPLKSFSPKQEQPEVTPSRDREPSPSPSSPKAEKAEVVETPTEDVAQPLVEAVEQVREVEVPQEEPREEPVAARSEKAAASVKGSRQVEKSEKNETQSRRTGQQVPLVTTKFKQVARADTPVEINLEKSLRLQSIPEPASSPKPASEADLKEKVLLWIFLVASCFVTYLAMHPNRKV